MQRQFTIELRVDYADQEKNTVMRAAVAAAARHVYATAQLLADQTKPQIAIFSDDFFSGNQQIELLEDVIAKGKDQMQEIGSGEAIAEDTGISPELAAAVQDATKS